MAFIIKDDLQAGVYSEVIDEITRADDAIVDKAINAGIAEVKSYLSRYDTVTLFDGSTLDETITEHLRNICIDVIKWQLFKLSNPNIDLKLARTNYEDVIAWLTKVQKGQADPVGWPYKPDDSATTNFNENATVQWSSNKKRRQSF